MAKSALPIILAGGAVLLLAGGKKKRRGKGMVFEDELVIGGGDELPSIGSNEVAFTPDLSKFKIGFGYRVNVLDAYLESRRKDGLLATVDHDAGWLYETFVDDPTTWLGDITGTGKVGGTVIYASLWMMATIGVGIYASGFAAAGANIQAATQAANATRAMQALGPRATQLAGQLYHKGYSSSRIALALMDFGGMESLSTYGVSKGIAAISAGALKSGSALTTGLLMEMGLTAAFAPDIAASASEAAAVFTLNNSVTIAGEQIPIALLPASYPAVQEFNKWLMAYIIRFQKMRFED